MTAPNPYKCVHDFEQALADFCGSKYAVCVESCTSAIFLSLMYCKQHEELQPNAINMPSFSYPGVACSIIHSGFKVQFDDYLWEGEYMLSPFEIWDAALKFKRDMYHGGFQCISFHGKKNLAIGRGGCILTDNEGAADWFRKARFDGRGPVPLREDVLHIVGWNCYLQPEQAARGLMLMQAILSKYPDGPPDLKVEDQKYSDLSIQPAYQKYIA